MTSRTMAYLEGKPKEDKSMPLKRGVQKVCMCSLASPVRMVKLSLLNPSPIRCNGTPVVAYLTRRHRNTHRYNSDVKMS